MKTKTPADKIYVLRIKADLFERVAKTAQRQDLTAAQFIRRVVRREIEAPKRIEAQNESQK